jgi:hypothetical protein
MTENKEETVGDLDGEIPVERVIDGDQVKLYRTRQVVAYLDGPVYDFGAASVTFGENPIPVYTDEMKKIGFAQVSIVRRGSDGVRHIVADIAIDYATEERLLAETQSEKLYPRVFGQMRVAAMPLFDFFQPITPLSLRIDGIQLSRVRTRDERISFFGSPL